ncbi:hypothetical protein, partial [uncultured Cobetia sp.]|uniref:hypothetical protein n=1 Tax=uncultured Cobetia sp. TaxID=410706 RepID=UPI0030EBA1FB
MTQSGNIAIEGQATAHQPEQDEDPPLIGEGHRNRLSHVHERHHDQGAQAQRRALEWFFSRRSRLRTSSNALVNVC